MVSTPPRPGHRGRLAPSPVAEAAQARGLTVVTPGRRGLRELGAKVRELGVEVLFVADFGRIMPMSLVEAAPLAVNVHPSLLPRHRGAAPIVRTLWEGDARTGVTLLGVGEEVDAAPIYDKVDVPVLADDDAGSLEGRLAQLAADRVGALVERISHLPGGPSSLPAVPQTGAASYAPKLTSSDEWLNLTRPAALLVRQVRALAPEPGAKIRTAEGPLLVLSAAADDDAVPDGPVGTVGAAKVGRLVLPVVRSGDTALRLLRVRPAGRRTMDGDAFLRGRPDVLGARWGGETDA